MCLDRGTSLFPFEIQIEGLRCIMVGKKIEENREGNGQRKAREKSFVSKRTIANYHLCFNICFISKGFFLSLWLYSSLDFCEFSILTIFASSVSVM